MKCKLIRVFFKYFYACSYNVNVYSFQFVRPIPYTCVAMSIKFILSNLIYVRKNQPLLKSQLQFVKQDKFMSFPYIIYGIIKHGL